MGVAALFGDRQGLASYVEVVIRVKTTYRVMPVNPVEQTVEESTTLEVEDASMHTVLREILVRRDIYLQEFLLLMANRSDFEFIGWWNN
jgi:hypothetical protein